MKKKHAFLKKRKHALINKNPVPFYFSTPVTPITNLKSIKMKFISQAGVEVRNKETAQSLKTVLSTVGAVKLLSVRYKQHYRYTANHISQDSRISFGMHLEDYQALERCRE